MTDTNVTPDIRLDRVVMPVILVMNHPDLSWAQREACASAVSESLRQYNSLMQEVKTEDNSPAERPPAKRRGS